MIKTKYFEMLVELCFLRAFIAWEAFLEDSFIIYLHGKKSPKGFSPKRYAMPKDTKHSMDLIFGGERYTDWASRDKVVARANRFFKNGEPYSSVLENIAQDLKEMKTIRNSIVHASVSSREKFKSLVRGRIRGGTFPSGLTVGGFLNGNNPAASNPISFLEYYIEALRKAGNDIAPS